MTGEHLVLVLVLLASGCARQPTESDDTGCAEDAHPVNGTMVPDGDDWTCLLDDTDPREAVAWILDDLGCETLSCILEASGPVGEGTVMRASACHSDVLGDVTNLSFMGPFPDSSGPDAFFDTEGRLVASYRRPVDMRQSFCCDGHETDGAWAGELLGDMSCEPLTTGD